MKFEAVREFALSLPDTTEEPHHQFGSFRVGGKIFVTTPPGEAYVHVFLAEEAREAPLGLYPKFVEKLLWGGKVMGVRVHLAAATRNAVQAMVRQAYEHKAKPASRAKR